MYCSECREKVEVPAEGFRLTFGRTATQAHYSFGCPLCGAAVRKPAGEKIVAALTAAGVRTMRLVPAEQ
ncbi:hypothetical protein ACFP3U_07190 [Kitasatospora misakiensis]|uniref:DUF5679 domain-containing protein n=1 Tax=Kitasatospora misakiensis TaxID=67330 RepID=A0ABW0X0N1_9ACTN